MRLRLVLAVLGWVCRLAAGTSDNLTDAVTWDKYSLLVNGSRVFINSGEFHYQRLPVPELWLDVLQKMKANGFNTVSVYFFWSYHSPSEGVYDFETSGKNIQKLFDYAKQAGLWVIARAGPYCNAETNGGGLALWGSDGSLGSIRSDDERYHRAWQPWIAKIGKIIADNQITNGGPVILHQIENELQETVHRADNGLVRYMEQVEAAFRDAGVVVPSTHNEKGMRSVSWTTDYQDVGGAVNVYGLDSYPGGLSCTNTATGFRVSRDYFAWFSKYSFTQPSYLAEFEGGWFSNWGSKTFYDDCTAEHDPAFADVYYKNNIGQRVTLQNIYMAYGGTNWGYSAAPQVYTSYDYSAPMRETREQWPKLSQTKLVHLFASSSPELLATEMVGNGAGFHVSDDSVFAWVLRNPTSNTTFTVIQQAQTPSTANVSVSAALDTSEGKVSVPDVALCGRQSKILVTDYTFGSHKLLYCSADILTHAVFDDADVLVLYLKEGQTGELAFADDRDGDLEFDVSGNSTTTVSSPSDKPRTLRWTQGAGATAVKLSNGVLLYLLEQQAAWRFWAPATTADPAAGPDQRLLVLGPYLVRSARVDGRDLHVSGDSDVATTLEAYVGPGAAIETVVWNGQRLPAAKTAHGSFTAAIPGAEDRHIELPALISWRSADSLPEADPAYDDSGWVVCDKTTTESPYAPASLPVLYSSDYGFYTGPKLYRGYFDTPEGDDDDDEAPAVNITASGGLGFGWDAWLNGVHVGGHPGDASLSTTSETLALPRSVLRRPGASENVLTVLVDYHGHDQASSGRGVLNPRGLLGAVLLPGGTRTQTGFRQWKIAGNAGGGAGYLDPVRGPMNEGGLHAERLGWFLPGFDPGYTSTNNNTSPPFNASSPLDGVASPGVRFYTTTFRLAVDPDLDAPLGIRLSAPPGTVARVHIWVNGYQFGRFLPHLGPQTRFPLPPGVVNTNPARPNTLALSLWAHDPDGARLDAVELFTYGAYQSDFGFDRDWSALQPPWEDRSRYA